MRSHSPIKTLAMLPLLAIGLGGIHSPQAQGQFTGSKSAILQMPQATSKRQLELIRAGGSPYRSRKPWPYRGKNRAQRQRLAAAFGNF